jgi:hypothetical protein
MEYKLKLKDSVARDNVQRQMLKEEVMQKYQDCGGFQQFHAECKKRNEIWVSYYTPPSVQFSVHLEKLSLQKKIRLTKILFPLIHQILL